MYTAGVRRLPFDPTDRDPPRSLPNRVTHEALTYRELGFGHERPGVPGNTATLIGLRVHPMTRSGNRLSLTEDSDGSLKTNTYDAVNVAF